jgi:two-component system, LytTR family, response regulator LytT
VIKKLLDKHSATPMPQIIFATAFDQYAVRAFDVNAIDYLLKPFDRARVLQALGRARERVEQQHQTEEVALEHPAPLISSDARLDALLRLLEQQKIPSRPQNGKIVLQTQNRLLLTDQSDICFASIEEGVISVVTPTLEGESKCRTLEELLELLDPAIFWRAHRSFVVNINHIKEVVPWFKSSYQLRMDDRRKTEIPVSRTQTRRLRELFKL